MAVIIRWKLSFQSTLPQGERLENARSFDGKVLFQSTLPQGERHRRRDNPQLRIAISIHAPARGATYGYREIWPINVDFNPRSRKGSDLNRLGFFSFIFSFQSTLPQGERHHRLSNHIFYRQFQSTLPQGERRNYW